MSHERRTGCRRISGDEYDALGKAKRWMTWRPGERGRIKAGYNRRVRRSWRVDEDDAAGEEC